MAQQALACVTGVKREERRGHLGARERERHARKEGDLPQVKEAREFNECRASVQ